ncbi:ABC transporter substrate-binding protein [Desertimonas flava]|uniref:ABC transporter substrate-binding protein n=1 Tax=Desertimonas flava TaxID=2064846 RepID=UPI0013C50E22|nr:ABC transporter substrate-binding protein [Desertimonas flava]
MKPTFGRREVIRRGLQVAGGLAVAGPAGRLLSGGVVAAGSRPASGDLIAVPYQLSWLPTTEHCGTYISITDGTFESLGLAVTPIPGGPTTQNSAIIVGGQALIGGDGAESIGAARVEGAPVKIFGARLQKNPMCVMSLADTPITTPEELIGKTIGVAQGNQPSWDVFLQIVGIDPGDVNVVPVQFDPSPTANGEVDGQVVFAINEPGQLQVQGFDTHVLLMADYGFSIFAGCYFATEETIDSEFDTLVNFLAGERAGFMTNLADPTIGRDLTVNEFGADLDLDPEQQLYQSQALATVMVTPWTTEHGLLSMSPNDIAANIATLALAGVEVGEDLFTTAVVDALPPLPIAAPGTLPGSSVPGSSVPGTAP